MRKYLFAVVVFTACMQAVAEPARLVTVLCSKQVGQQASTCLEKHSLSAAVTNPPARIDARKYPSRKAKVRNVR